MRWWRLWWRSLLLVALAGVVAWGDIVNLQLHGLELQRTVPFAYPVLILVGAAIAYYRQRERQ